MTRNLPLIALKRAVYRRDKGQCVYCGRKLAQKTCTMDHLIPIEKGGETAPCNVVVSCATCNIDKDNELPLIYMARRAGFLSRRPR